MIVAPPGEPSARKGRPPLVTIVGAIELLGRLPPSTRFGCVVESKLKSVNSLLSRNPKPGTTSPAPPVDSIVNVYETTVPDLSDVVRWVVVSPPSNGYGSPGGTGPGAAVAMISARRVAAYSSESSPARGTSK